MLVKFGAVIFKLKIFTVAGSMIVSVGAYALLGGWWFGLGLVLLIFVHEMGHVLELRRQGVPASAPLFIPFMGAVVGMKQMPENAWKEAQVALAGPLLGTLGAAVVWGLGAVYDSNFLRAMAFLGFLINLFNLLPVVPLDGGRAAAALHPALWAVGLAGLIALAFYPAEPDPAPSSSSSAAWSCGAAGRRGNHPEFAALLPRDAVAADRSSRSTSALRRFLVFAMHETHVPRSF